MEPSLILTVEATVKLPVASIVPALKPAKPVLSMVPAEPPVSVVNTDINAWLASFHTKAVLIGFKLRFTKIPTSYAGAPTYPLLNTTNGSLTNVLVLEIVLIPPSTLRLPEIVTFEFKVRFGLKRLPTSVPAAIF